MEPNQTTAVGHACASHHSRHDKPVSCALVLAGGEGKRLRSFVHLLRRDLLPKQYVNFIGRRSMLEHTLSRAEELVSLSSVFTVVNAGHLIFPEVRQQLAARHQDTVLVQPENKDTAPGILFSLIHIAKLYPNSIVTMLPSDHFVLKEENLANCLKFADGLVKRDSSRLVLLGIEPDHEETEYGYIVPGAKVKRGKQPAWQISSFVEKPDNRTAETLTRRGALWNTMMMVCHTATMLEIIKNLSSALFAAFEPLIEAVGPAEEKSACVEIYRELQPVNFSKDILEPLAHQTSRLLTLPVRDVLWSDWGSESRIMEVLRMTGHAARLNGLNHRPEPRAASGYGELHPSRLAHAPSLPRRRRAEAQPSELSAPRDAP
jgi:mannose-1-phosphate guanylyltransferase